MDLIDAIRAKVIAGEFEYSPHAVDQSIQRRIPVEALRTAISTGEVI